MYQISTKEETFALSKVGNITIKGYSRSMYRTGYLIQPYNIYLDAGLPSPVPASLVLVSHGHYDHIASLFSLLVDSENSVVMMPASIKSSVQKMLDGFRMLNSGTGLSFRNWTPITTLYHEMVVNNKNITIETFELDHRVVCHAYGIKQIHKKLKEEYINLSESEIIELKKTTNITTNVSYPILLFISDTGKSVLTKLPFNEYSLVIIECTFIDDDHYSEACKRKHLHWNDLEPLIKSNPQTTFILGHFSCRYKDDYLKKFSKSVVYTNVKFWI